MVLGHRSSLSLQRARTSGKILAILAPTNAYLYAHGLQDGAEGWFRKLPCSARCVVLTLGCFVVGMT
jgi:hypothetical protein